MPNPAQELYTASERSLPSEVNKQNYFKFLHPLTFNTNSNNSLTDFDLTSHNTIHRDCNKEFTG